jgi:hypothetical protein
MYYTKRGQIEMIGLLIVVVLILVGVLFYIKFATGVKEDNKMDSVQESIFANNLVLGMGRMEFCDVKFADAIYEVYQNGNLCGVDANNYLGGEIGKIIEATEWPGDYQLTVLMENEDGSFFNPGIGCEYGPVSESYIFSSNSMNFEVRLRLCL